MDIFDEVSLNTILCVKSRFELVSYLARLMRIGTHLSEDVLKALSIDSVAHIYMVD
jgi:hypothetical protein